MTAKHVPGHTQGYFSEHRWPDTLVSDKGPCLATHEFKQAMEEMGVHHTTSSSHHNQSNGLAERSTPRL